MGGGSPSLEDDAAVKFAPEAADEFEETIPSDEWLEEMERQQEQEKEAALAADAAQEEEEDVVIGDASDEAAEEVAPAEEAEDGSADADSDESAVSVAEEPQNAEPEKSEAKASAMAETYIGSGSSYAHINAKVDGTYEESQITDVRLVDKNGNDVATTDYVDSWASGGDDKYTQISASFRIYKNLTSGDYTVKCKLDGKEQEIAVVHVTKEMVVSNVYVPGGYDAGGDTFTIEVSGANLNPEKAPTLKIGDAEAAKLVNSLPAYSNSYFFRYEKLKKGELWNGEDGKRLTVTFPSGVIDQTDGSIYVDDDSDDAVQYQYYNWKKKQFEVYFKPGSKIPDGTNVTVEIHEEWNDGQVIASASGSVSGNQTILHFKDASGNDYVPERNRSFYFAYRFEGTDREPYESSEYVQWYNYYNLSKVSFYSDTIYQKAGVKEVPIKVGVLNTAIVSGQKITAKLGEIEVQLSAGKAGDEYTPYEGTAKLSAAAAEGTMSLQVYQGEERLGSSTVYFVGDAITQTSQSGYFESDTLFRIYVWSPNFYVEYKDKGNKITDAQAKAYWEKNLQAKIYGGDGKELSASFSKAEWSYGSIYAYYTVKELNDYLSVWVKVMDKNGNLLKYPGSDKSYYTYYGGSYYSEELGYYSTRSSSGLGVFSSSNVNAYTGVYVEDTSLLPVKAYFTKINDSEILKTITISKLNGEDYYFTKDDLSGLKDPETNAYSLHLEAKNYAGANYSTGYFAVSSSTPTPVEVVDYAIYSGDEKVSAISFAGTGDAAKTLTLYNGGTKVSSGVTWKSSNEAVAIVSSKGEVSPRGGGQATITATTSKGSASVTVSVALKLEKITASTDKLTLSTNEYDEETPYQLSYTLFPKGVAAEVSAEVSDEIASAAVDAANGKVSLVPLKEGTGTLTLTASAEGEEPKSVTVALTVVSVDEDLLDALRFEYSHLAFTKNGTLEQAVPAADLLKGTPYEEAAKAYNFKWASPDTDLSAYANKISADFTLTYDKGGVTGRRSVHVRFVTVNALEVSLKKEDGALLADGQSVLPGAKLTAAAVPSFSDYDYEDLDDKALYDLDQAITYAWSGAVTGSGAAISIPETADGKVTLTASFGTISTEKTFNVAKESDTAVFGNVTYGNEAVTDAGLMVTFADVKDKTGLALNFSVTKAGEVSAESSDNEIAEAGALVSNGDGSYTLPLTFKAAGTAAITLKAGDKAGTFKTVSVTVMDPAITLGSGEVSLNWMYKYGTALKITPSAGYTIESASISSDANLSLTGEGSYWTLLPYAVNGETKTWYGKDGEETVTVNAKLSRNGAQFDASAELKVTLTGQAPTFAPKQTEPVNNFYDCKSGRSYGTLSLGTYEDVTLSMEGFTFMSDNDGVAYVAPATNNAKSAKGDLTATFEDYVDASGNPYKITQSKFQIKVATTAPKYAISQKSVTLYPAAGITSASVYLTDAEGYPVDDIKITPETKGTIAISQDGGTVTFTAADAKAKAGAVKLALSSEEWNKDNKTAQKMSLSVSVSINKKAPALELSAKTITLNGSEEMWQNACADVAVTAKGASGLNLNPANFSIAPAKAADNKAFAALGSIECTFDTMGSDLKSHGAISLMNKIGENGLAAGTYKAIVKYSGSGLEMTAPLTIKVVNTNAAKSLALKAGKTKIELLDRDGDNSYAGYTVSLKGANGTLSDAELADDSLADYFNVYSIGSEIRIRAISGSRLLEAKDYSVKLNYTLTTANGESMTFPATVKVRPTQGKPKLALNPKKGECAGSATTAALTAELKGMSDYVQIADVKVKAGKGDTAFSASYNNGAVTFTKLEGAKKGANKLTLDVTFEDA
ncbi:MAG: Ig-like domain-containing protein, partial [Lachnospiraceae bacterium]|nr:Ig-like domain-containing protein [Lachnospiraceae bacterium]